MEAPSWLPSPHSSRCGSPSRSTTSVAPPLSTASASKRIPIFEEEKQQHTGSYRHHLHLLVSGVFPFFSIQPYFVWSTDIVQLHSTLLHSFFNFNSLYVHKISHPETFVHSLTVYWHHFKNIRILCVIFYASRLHALHAH